MRTVGGTKRAIEQVDTQFPEHRGIKLRTNRKVRVSTIRYRPGTVVGKNDTDHPILGANQRLNLLVGRTFCQQGNPDTVSKGLPERCEESKNWRLNSAVASRRHHQCKINADMADQFF